MSLRSAGLLWLITLFATASAGCFVSCTDCKSRRGRQRTIEPLSVSKDQLSVSMGSTAPPSIFDTNGEFNLQKARLMARFASVAYEDPPTAKANAAGTTQMVDDYGVTITRPAAMEHKADKSIDGVENMWDMTHVEAMSPRPLMLMFSDCNSSGNSGVSDVQSSRFQWVSLATNRKSSTQFDVWRITPSKDVQQNGSSNNILVVAFRGTRLSSLSELYTDIQLKQDMISCVDFGFCMDEATGQMSDVGSEEVAGLMAHSGFLKAYASIRPTLLRVLSDNEGTYSHIWFTGHSLGAALATLAVVDVGSLLSAGQKSMPSKTINSLPSVSISSYLFGTPRVGNRQFVKQLARLQQRPDPSIEAYYRINTPGDAVPYLPRGKEVNRLGIDYVHAGASVFLPSSPSEGGATNEVTIYPIGDQPPDPLSEIDPGYSGFFPINPRTWTSSESFRSFLSGEIDRSILVLQGGFLKNHRLKKYEDELCLASDKVCLIEK